MKRFVIGTISIILSVIAILSIKDIVLHNSNTKHVSAAVFGTDTNAIIPSETGTKGTSSNPFVVLEIVPYEGYAEIGYMIKGSEPVPMNKLTGDELSLVASTSSINYNTNLKTFTYNNLFLRNALRIPEEKVDDYKIQVVTVTPKELNQSDKQAWIDRADLIYISPRGHFSDNALAKLWEKYHPDKVVSNRPTGFMNNDFTWETTVKLLRKVSKTKDYAPIIFEVTVFTEDNSYHNGVNNSNKISPIKKYSTGNNVDSNFISSKGYVTNVAKLYMVMQQMQPAKFVHDYIDTEKVVSVKMKNADGSIYKNGNVEMTTGCYKEQYNGTVGTNTYYKISTEDPSVVWNIYTFLPFQLFSGYEAVRDDKCWAALGIDNYRVIVDGGASNVSVRHNFYSYNGNNAITQHFTDDGEISYNQYSKEAFDYYHMSSGSISPAKAIYYLLNYKKPEYKRSLLRILEIEPCNDFIWDGSRDAWNVSGSSNGSNDARQYFTKFFPNFNGKVVITRMTSSEFIGKIEDLNSNYDLIFFGLKDGALRKSNSTTVYNDSSLNGRVYLHNGDKISNVASKLQGLSGSNDNSYRFSGNDITALNLSQLKEFMLGGNPIILDKGFYTNSLRSNVNSGDNGKIDPESNIFELANLKDYPQLFYADGIPTDEVEELLSTSKCKIIFGKLNDSNVSASSCYPVVYRDRTRVEYSDLTDNQIYINSGTDSNFRTLQYQFYIDDENLSDKYQVQLFIDINADGKFDEDTENVKALNILNDKGYSIKYNELMSGVNYTVTRTLEPEYFGILPWKLVITSNSNGSSRDSVINYCAIKAKEKIKLNILQIKADKDNTVDLSNDDPLSPKQPVFQQYIKNLKDYDVRITSMSVSQFSAECKNGAYTYLLSDRDDDSGKIMNSTKVKERFDDDGDGIYDFDMLILGFADMYTDIGNENALHNLKDYIDEGKTVLFTHDTTSFVNLPEVNYPDKDFWGYGLNKYFRNTFGMDRFGATLNTREQRISENKDYSLKKGDYSNYIQGYSNMILNRYAPANTGYKDQYGSNKAITLGSSFDNSFKTNYVTNVNRGQLTNYPYQIDDNFQVATTHAQYYQLDMEAGDTVVWYCLSDAKDGSGFYSATPNDVRNNYYIYNKGNITYSGVGHSALSSDITDTAHNMEVKLFVNTIIAAYSASAKQSQIMITNKNKSVDSNGKEYVYVDYDIYNTTQAIGSEVNNIKQADDAYVQSQRIKYCVVDNNILFNKVLTVKYYYVDQVTNMDGSKTTKTEEINLPTKSLRYSDIKSTDKGDIINSGDEYYFEIPLSELNNSNSSRTIMIRVVTTYGKASDKTSITEKSFTLVRRGLFDLD